MESSNIMKNLFTICWLIEFGLLAVIVSDNKVIIQSIESAALPYAVFFGIIGLATKHWNIIKRLV